MLSNPDNIDIIIYVEENTNRMLKQIPRQDFDMENISISASIGGSIGQLFDNMGYVVVEIQDSRESGLKIRKYTVRPTQ